ncbi:MAG: 23S rRNA (adenine(2503)-C(2))-methyltransferase RlmN, partial [Eubacteriales bacterium]
MMLLDLSLEELQSELKSMGEPAFRAKQIRSWLSKGMGPEEMANLPSALREKLKEHFTEGFAKTEKKLTSADGTKKYLFSMQDGNTVEAVYMLNNYGNSVCLSTQVGCRMGCVFCESCKNGFVRNLSAGEMLGQYIAMNTDAGQGRNIANIVLMGMGEPMDNYDNVIRFLKLVHEKETYDVSYRNISVSTCGIVPGILALAEENLPVTLCVSLHSPFDEKRMEILPAAKMWSVAEIIAAAKTFFEKTGRRFIIEYALMDGFNNRREDVQELKNLLRGMACHINLIPLNATTGCAYNAPSKKDVFTFCGMLEREGLSATVRRSLGSDILGACGQLKNST